MSDRNDKKSPFYNMTEGQIVKLINGEYKKIYDSGVSKNKTLSNCRSVMRPLLSKDEIYLPIIDRLKATVFNMRKGYTKLSLETPATFLISLSSKGYIELKEAERKYQHEVFNRPLTRPEPQTLLGYPYVIRREQPELFKVIER